MILQRHQVELLEGLLRNEEFAVLLTALAEQKRTDLLYAIESAHYAQNPQAAAMAMGQMQAVENLPRFFSELLSSQGE